MRASGDILVIEDDAALGDFILTALGEEGYAVRVVPDAAQAGVMLSMRMPDLIVCELHLPGLSGHDLIVQVQQTLPADVPIVIMTADPCAARRLAHLNVASCLVKPFDLDTLYACVAAHSRVPS